MLRLLSISRLLKKESGIRMWVMMMMVVAWVLIETVENCMEIKTEKFTAIV